MQPIKWQEDAEARRWLAGESLWMPLVALKLASPLLTLGAVALLVYQHQVQASFTGALVVLIVAIALPAVLALKYPALRWLPQEWAIDAEGIQGRGRRTGRWSWPEIRWWESVPIDRLPAHVCLCFSIGTRSRWFAIRMLVPAPVRAAVEAWLHAAAATAGRREA